MFETINCIAGNEISATLRRNPRCCIGKASFTHCWLVYPPRIYTIPFHQVFTEAQEFSISGRDEFEGKCNKKKVSAEWCYGRERHSILKSLQKATRHEGTRSIDIPRNLSSSWKYSWSINTFSESGQTDCIWLIKHGNLNAFKMMKIRRMPSFSIVWTGLPYLTMTTCIADRYVNPKFRHVQMKVIVGF